MPNQYETNFIVQSGDGLSGSQLLKAVVEAIENELQSADGEADYELEANQYGKIGYAHFSGERSHPSLPAAVRLESRLCTLDDGPDVAVQVLTRFISADGADLPERPAGPPRLLDAITGRFQCRSGSAEVSSQPVEINTDSVESFATRQVLNPDRPLPIFLITQNTIDPTMAQRWLQGVALVAYCVGDADQSLARHTGIRTYGGATRIYWPGCQFGKNGPKPAPGIKDFCMPAEARQMSWYDIQDSCLTGNPELEFDIRFSSARTAVILERNRQLEAANRERDMRPEVEDNTRVAELEKAKRRAEVRSNELSRQLQTAKESIEQLTKETEESTEIISELEEELDELSQHSSGATGEGRDERSRLRRQHEELRARAAEQEKTIAKLNDDNQRLRQRERMRDSVNGRTLRLGAGLAGNITTLNHALNVYREPCRKFIVQKLQASHGRDLTDVLSKSIEFRENQRSNAAERPEAAFDIGDFSAIIAANWDCFEDWTLLRRRMDDVRHIRNRAAHPPPEGFDENWTQDSLRTIVETLKSLGDKQSEECVSEIWELTETIRSV